MTMSSIDAVCTKCGAEFDQVPKQSFLGFQKITCPTCHEGVTYPLTRGYRVTYWVVLGLMFATALITFSEGSIAYPGGIGLAVIYGLFKDGSIRSRLTKSTSRTPTAPLQETVNHYVGPLAFFRKHFNGDYSLGRSYWVNNTLISLFAPILGVLFLPWLEQNFDARYSSTAFLFITLFGCVAWTWAVSGTWASANKHVSRGGTQFWSSAAKVMIVLGFIKTFGDITTLTPVLAEHIQVASGRQPGSLNKLEVLADGKSIRLSGGINDGTSDQLAKALDLAPSVTTLVLSSEGGWIRQGEMLATLIKARKLRTYVETKCASACTIAFLAGHERSADPDAKIGFHSVKIIGSNGNMKHEEDQATRTAYERANLPPDFLHKIAATPTDQMWYPTNDELIAAGVLTRRSMGGESSSVSTNVRSREALDAGFKTNALFQAIAEKYPDIYKRLVDAAWLKMQQGKSDAEVMTAARMEITSMSQKLMPLASNETLIAFNSLMSAEVNAVEKIDAVACSEIFFPSGRALNTASFIPKELQQRELDLMQRVVVEANPSRAIKPNENELQGLLVGLVGNMSKEEISAFTSKESRDENPAVACSAASKFLSALESLPPLARVRALRLIYAAN